MLKPSSSNVTFASTINPKPTLEINYYDPYGNKVGNHQPKDTIISSTQLKETIDSNIPQDYQIVPYFAYPQHGITNEIMIAVKANL